jgi:hypothetical protein
MSRNQDRVTVISIDEESRYPPFIPLPEGVIGATWTRPPDRTRSAMRALLKLALSIALDNTPLFNQISATSLKPAHLIALKLRLLQWYINFHFLLS